MLLADLVAASAAIAATRSRLRKIEALAGCLARMDPDEIRIGASYLAGAPRQPRLDVGWATLRAVDVPPAETATLTLHDVDRALDGLVGISGPGSKATRLARLGELFRAATEPEQRFLRGLLLGELRQGALAGIAAQGIARAYGVDEAAVRRALMLNADLGEVAAAAATGGAEALARFTLQLFRPLGPMLASTASSVAEALEAAGGTAAVEHKLDGARVQVHRVGDEVRVFTRNLRDVTARSPEVVAVVAALPVARIVLDGEVLALRPDGRPHAFQDTMARFGSEDAQRAAARAGAIVLTPFFFDVLHLDGEDLVDAPYRDRVAALDRVVPASNRVLRVVVDDPEAGDEVFAGALAAGHEGVVVKTLDTPYEAGRRGAAWRKVKPAHTLDLVVLAAEWGSGRRRGWLSNLHLGARDPEGGFVMLGKTFKGLTDQTLTWQTEQLLARETARDGIVVHVRPELVVEVAFDGVQTSTRYPGGVALRFARVKRYRPDKSPAEADTIDTVRAIAAGRR